MKNQWIIVFCSLSFLMLQSCNHNKIEIEIINSSSSDRIHETVEIALTDLGCFEAKNLLNLGVLESESREQQVVQYIDKDSDGKKDHLIFQPKVKAYKSNHYIITEVKSTLIKSNVFSRFVPERADDYAWENDKVAFRIFGAINPKIKEKLSKNKNYSSGIDCWLKKVEYPIIDKWYRANGVKNGYYHKDIGEGLDNFHVGASRGCGGTGVYLNDSLYVSRNFTGYKKLTSGPVRTSFTLDYQPWKAENQLIEEQKNISLDLGSNLMKVALKVKGTKTISVGLTLHEKDGKTAVDVAKGWFSYWQPHGKKSELGTAILVDSKYYDGYTTLISETKDQSHLLVHLKVIDGITEYKTGFGWKGSHQFLNAKEWQDYLSKEADMLKNTLEVRVIHKKKK